MFILIDLVNRFHSIKVMVNFDTCRVCTRQFSGLITTHYPRETNQLLAQCSCVNFVIVLPDISIYIYASRLINHIIGKMENKKEPRKYSVIVFVGLLTSTLDAMAAIISAHKIPAASIFKFIASGVFGKAAFEGGTGMVIAGIFFHYLIASSITVVLFLLYPKFITFLKNKYVVAVVFALLAWVITNLVIVPLSRIGWRPMQVDGIVTGFIILIITIGLPIALIADWYFFRSKKKKEKGIRITTGTT